MEKRERFIDDVVLCYIEQISWREWPVLHSLPSPSLWNPCEPGFLPHPSRRTVISTLTDNWHIAKYNNLQSSVYLISTLLINLLFLKHLFHLASRTPISVLLLHYWQFYCRLFSWCIQTSKIWSAPSITLLCCLTITFLVILRLMASMGFFMQILPWFISFIPEVDWIIIPVFSRWELYISTPKMSGLTMWFALANGMRMEIMLVTSKEKLYEPACDSSCLFLLPWDWQSVNPSAVSAWVSGSRQLGAEPQQPQGGHGVWVRNKKCVYWDLGSLVNGCIRKCFIWYKLLFPQNSNTCSLLNSCVLILYVSNKPLIISLQSFPSCSFLNLTKWWFYSSCWWDPDFSLISVLDQSTGRSWEPLKTLSFYLWIYDCFGLCVCVLVTISPWIQLSSTFIRTNCSNPLTSLCLCLDLLYVVTYTAAWAIVPLCCSTVSVIFHSFR